MQSPHLQLQQTKDTQILYYARLTQAQAQCRQLSSISGSSISFNTVSSSVPTSTIDEFRAREEQRERDFSQQQIAEEAKSQQSSSETEDDAKKAKINALRKQILDAALSFVPQHGWSRKAIVAGAEQVGFPSVIHGMFPEGGYALVAHFVGRSNEELVQELRKQTKNGQQLPDNPLDFVVQAVRLRLEMILPYKGQWPQALGLIALPQNASTALAQVLTLVDDICYYSGDRSVDFGWYTRRIGLGTILKMTELYMLQDSSPQHANTWEFLQHRMEEAVQIQSMLAETENISNRFTRSFNSAFITARNILGINFDRR